MKTLIPILIGLLVVGCGKAKQPTNTTQDNNTKAKPVKEITKKDIVGTYELESDGNILRMVFLENGDFENYKNNEKTHSFTWKIVDGKIYVQDELGEGVWVVDKDSSITRVAYLIDGKSQEWAAQNQETYKKFQSEKMKFHLRITTEQQSQQKI